MILFSILGGGAVLALGSAFMVSAYRNRQKTQALLEQATSRVELAKKSVADERRDSLMKLKDEMNRRRIEFKNELNVFCQNLMYGACIFCK